MSKRQIDRIEIVQTDAEQPWSVRVFRNRQTFRSSENYARKIGAQRAVVGLAKTFGWESPLIMTEKDGTSFVYDAASKDVLPLSIPVLYLRELAGP